MDNAVQLPLSHPMRADPILAARTGVELRERPRGRTPMDRWNQWEDIEAGHIRAEDVGMARLSILYELPYWKVILLTRTVPHLHWQT